MSDSHFNWPWLMLIYIQGRCEIGGNQVYNQGTKRTPSWMGKVMEDIILSHKLTLTKVSIPLLWKWNDIIIIIAQTYLLRLRPLLWNISKENGLISIWTLEERVTPWPVLPISVVWDLWSGVNIKVSITFTIILFYSVVRSLKRSRLSTSPANICYLGSTLRSTHHFFRDKEKWPFWSISGVYQWQPLFDPRQK